LLVIKQLFWFGVLTPAIALKEFFLSIDSIAVQRNIWPFYTFHKNSFPHQDLHEFPLKEEYVHISLKIILHSVQSVRPLLRTESQKEISEILVPFFSSLLSQESFGDDEIALVLKIFKKHQIALGEMKEAPKTIPFASLIENILDWFEK
jgi:hypothetical protein